MPIILTDECYGWIFTVGNHQRRVERDYKSALNSEKYWKFELRS